MHKSSAGGDGRCGERRSLEPAQPGRKGGSLPADAWPVRICRNVHHEPSGRAWSRAHRPRSGPGRHRSTRPYRGPIFPVHRRKRRQRVPVTGCARRMDAGAPRQSIMPPPAGDELGVETFPVYKFSHQSCVCQLFAVPYAADAVGLCSHAKVRSGGRGSRTRGQRRWLTVSKRSRLSRPVSCRAREPGNRSALCSAPAASPMDTCPTCGRQISRDAVSGGLMWNQARTGVFTGHPGSAPGVQHSLRHCTTPITCAQRSQLDNADRTRLPGNSFAPAVLGLQPCAGPSRTPCNDGSGLCRISRKYSA